MPTTIKVKSGRSWATVTGPTAVELEALVREAFGPAIARGEAEMEKIRKEHIDVDWPVKTGTSRDAWHVSVALDPSKLKAWVTLDNPNAYVRYIRTTREGKSRDATRSRSPLQTEVRKPVAEAKKILVPEFKRLLVEFLKTKVFHG